MNKRDFIRKLFLGTVGFTTLGISSFNKRKASAEHFKSSLYSMTGSLFFDISLAEWSLHKSIFSGEIDHLDFAGMAKKEFDIHAVEYVNQFFKDKAKDHDYLKEMKFRAEDAGVKSLLIMIDEEGNLGAPVSKERLLAVENHYKWVEAANFLGCHSIRVNAAGYGTAEEVSKAAIEGLRQLSTFAKDFNINIIVENHGGYSSDGQWLANVISHVHMENCGTLPDFGNFCIEKEDPEDWNSPCVNEYDRYKGVKKLMPYAKGVSAKSFDFDEAGKEIYTDFHKMLKIVKDSGFNGYVGIEYEGNELDEITGIKATKALLLEVAKGI